MFDISLITSLYRSDTHLATYLGHMQHFVTAMQAQHGLTVQIVIVANDATAQEQTLLAPYEAHETLRVLYVPRESLYASWHRGIKAAQADILGFWNVDDARYVDGVWQAYTLLNESCDLTDSPFDIMTDNRISQTHPAQYNPQAIMPRNGVSAFFMFRRDLYERAGPFHPQFRIAGDYEWATRSVVRQARIGYTQAAGGAFVRHAQALSGTGQAREWVEWNMIALWRGVYHEIRPCDPHLMQRLWYDWGHKGGHLPDDIAAYLWGDGAQQRYEQYQRERNQHPLLRRIRLALASRGLVRSVEWQTHNTARFNHAMTKSPHA